MYGKAIGDCKCIGYTSDWPDVKRFSGQIVHPQKWPEALDYEGKRVCPETEVRLAICDSLSLATVVLLNDLGASALESQDREPDPSFGSSAIGRSLAGILGKSKP